MIPSPITLEPGPMLSQQEFELFRRFILIAAGIDLAPSKRALVQSRLAKRLRTLHLESYRAYWTRLTQSRDLKEQQIVINLLSTNETYFFRESQHFSWLKHYAEQHQATCHAPLRIWSAACSTGEEAYSAAMVLAEVLGINECWRIYATDINTRVIPFARRAIYDAERARQVPPHLWPRYFQRGLDEFTGKIRVKPELTRKVAFSNLNLLTCDNFAERHFDVIFLRNVLIYFNDATKARVLSQLCERLKPGGYLLIGHSEIIRQNSLPLIQEAPSRYRCQLPQPKDAL
ncbi:CheR family methyltransferase [Aeromonas enteropelogenes]|uniref:CheR family methyltransferase n=1 Tax=Aeromonas enteropelogenes TaxID=29489 RepID=UPI003BA382A5